MPLEFKLIDDIKFYGLLTKHNKTANAISSGMPKLADTGKFFLFPPELGLISFAVLLLSKSIENSTLSLKNLHNCLYL